MLIIIDGEEHECPSHISQADFVRETQERKMSGEKKNYWSDPDQQLQGKMNDAIRQVQEKGLIPELTGDGETDRMLADCIKTMSSKGKEYTGGSPDRLNNFRQAGIDVGVPMHQVWYVYYNKHLRALQSYIKNDCKVQSNETIQSRIMDCIVYLLLFNKMTLEIERSRAPKADPAATAFAQLGADTFNGTKTERCDDCGSSGGPFIDKGDHHGGTKHVCEDRTGCHQRNPS